MLGIGVFGVSSLVNRVPFQSRKPTVLPLAVASGCNNRTNGKRGLVLENQTAWNGLTILTPMRVGLAWRSSADNRSNRARATGPLRRSEESTA